MAKQELFEIGSKVKVSDQLGIFSSYKDWAEMHSLKNYKEHTRPKKGSELTVVARGFHGLDPFRKVYGIEDDNGNQYIIGQDSLKKASDQKLSVDVNLFSDAFDSGFGHPDVDIPKLIDECFHSGSERRLQGDESRVMDAYFMLQSYLNSMSQLPQSTESEDNTCFRVNIENSWWYFDEKSGAEKACSDHGISTDQIKTMREQS